MFDVLIKGGEIVDGTGKPGFKGDVAIRRDRVEIVSGDTSTVQAARNIEAKGCVVAPGIIDSHTHSDLVALAEPRNEPKIMQGVTTEMMGSDGIGYAPLSKEDLQKMLLLFAGVNGFPKLDYSWGTIPEYMERFDHKMAGNAARLTVPSSFMASPVTLLVSGTCFTQTIQS